MSDKKEDILDIFGEISQQFNTENNSRRIKELYEKEKKLKSDHTASEYRIQRLRESTLSYVNQRRPNRISWEEYEKQQKQTSGQISPRIVESQKAALSDEEVEERKQRKFTLKRRGRFITEDGQVMEDTSFEVKRITPKPPKYVARNKPVIPKEKIKNRITHKERETALKGWESGNTLSLHLESVNAKSIDFMEQELRFHKIALARIVQEALERVSEGTSWHENRIEKLNKLIEAKRKQFKQQEERSKDVMEKIKNMDQPPEPEKVETLSKPLGMLETMRGWLRGMAQRFIKILERV